MDLSLSELVRIRILPPADRSPAISPGKKIRSMVILEGGPSFFEHLPQHALVFFPHGASAGLSPSQLLALGKAQCAAVLYASDPLLAFPGSQFPLPVFVIPDTCSISKVIEECYQYAFSGIQKLAEVSLNAMERLSNELLSHKSEDANMISVAAELLECPVAFTTSDFHLQQGKNIPQNHLVNPLYVEDSFDWDLALEGFQVKQETFCPHLAQGIDGKEIGGYLHENAYCRQNGYQIYIFPISYKTSCYGYLFLSLNRSVQSLSPEMCMKIQQILAVLKFEIIKSNDIAQTVNRYYDFLLDELLESDRTDFRTLMQKYGLMQKPIADAYYILIAGRSPRNTQDKLQELLTSQQFNLLYDRIMMELKATDFFLFERREAFIIFLPQPLAASQSDCFDRLAALLKQFLKDQYQGIGISDAVSTEQVRKGYFQADKALSISHSTAGQPPCFFSDLGILRFFFDRSNQLDPEPLLQVYEEYIQPILKYDKMHSGELFPTLATYLECGSSPSGACSSLFIHKNTLYSRLNKISQLLGKNLSDSEVHFNLVLGVKVHTLVKAGIFQV